MKSTQYLHKGYLLTHVSHGFWRIEDPAKPFRKEVATNKKGAIEAANRWNRIDNIGSRL